jgi:hypothetical protein
MSNTLARRDEFAKATMQAIIAALLHASVNAMASESCAVEIAVASIKMADAMIAELDKENK